MRGKWERKESGRKEKKGRKENWEENVIPYVAWMEEGKHRGKKTGTCQSDKNTPIVNTFVKNLYKSTNETFLEIKINKGNKYNTPSGP